MVFHTLDLSVENNGVGRSRTLSMYDGFLGFPLISSVASTGSGIYGRSVMGPPSNESFLYSIIKTALILNKELVWVDLGCGNEVALRQAKYFLEKDGINPNKLKTYGVDLHPLDYEDVKQLGCMYPSEYPESLLDDVYSPIRICEDITKVTFPEAPTLITGVHVLQWTEDPLAVFTNSVNQLVPGGIIGLHKTGHIYFVDDNQTHIENSIPPETHPLLFEELFGLLKQSGFCEIYREDTAILVQKTKASEFAHDLKLFARTHGNQAFRHLYAQRD